MKDKKMTLSEKWSRISARGKFIIVGLLILAVVIIFTTAFVVIRKYKRKNNDNGAEKENPYTYGLIMQQLKIPKMKQDSTEENVASDDDVEEFFEEVNQEDEEALDLSQVEPHAVCEPYDGAVRTVSCWGDSMTYGVGVSSATNAYPGVLASLTGLTVYNMGGPSEDSLEIATRQGAFGMHTDREIVINEESATTVRFISDYNGHVITFGNSSIGKCTDASGYSFRAEPVNHIAGLCYMNHIPVVAVFSGGDTMEVRYCKEAQILELALLDIGNRRCSVLSDVTNQVLLCNYVPSNNNTKELEQQQNTQTETETSKSDETQTNQNQTEHQEPEQITPAAQPDGIQKISGNNKNETIQPSEQNETETPTEMIPESETPKVLTNITIPSGALVMTRASIDRTNDILILEIGSNGGWNSNYQVLINQYNRMIDSIGCKYFIVVGDTDDPGTSVGDGNQTSPYDEYGNYIGIGDTAWEATLRKAYGNHFVNMRVELIKHGLNYAGLNTTEEDLNRYVYGFISEQLRSDWTHLNSNGYYAKGRVIYAKGKELGYWN